jgi:hypothetical protein
MIASNESLEEALIFLGLVGLEVRMGEMME